MTKVVFEVGLLGFFVSALYFGIQGMPLMDMVLRSFIVFIALVLVQTAIFIVVASMKSPKKPVHEKPHVDNHRTPPVESQASNTTTSP